MTKILKVVGASWLQTKISSYILGILGILAILALFAGQIERIQEDGIYAATVFYSDKTGYRIEYWGQSNDLLDLQKGVARAYFRHDVETTGWSVLEIETDGSYPDEIQAYAAGIVEGALTWSLIHAHIENNIQVKCEDPKVEKQCDKLRDALDKSVDTWKVKASELEDVDPYWHHISLHFMQISGIYTGWNYGISKSLNEIETDLSDLYWINAIGEIPELEKKLNISIGSIFDDVPDLSSAFFRLANETSADGIQTKKLYVAQNAAGSYSTMNRILKRYQLHYHLTSSKDSPMVPGVSVEFSGYPGAITSQDEFYILRGQHHRMAVTGTALRNYNENLLKDINIMNQIPLAPRVTAANHLASNVTSWSHNIAANNSGTGCKQWLVVDFNQYDHYSRLSKDEVTAAASDDVFTDIKVDNGTGIRHIMKYHTNNKHPRNLLLLIEQVPGLTHTRDISQAFLQQQYWNSIGLPYIKDIADITHITQMEELYGNVFSNTNSPRALAIKQRYENATTMENIIKLMRHNNLTAITASNNTEPCENEFECIINEPGYWHELGARGDTVILHKRPYGVINTKVVCGIVDVKLLEFVAIAGPPYSEVANSTKTPINKGNLVTIYTDKFDDQPTINTLEIRNLVKQQQEKAEHDALEKLNKEGVSPFQWSESEFKDVAHDTLPDKWAFSPFTNKWTW